MNANSESTEWDGSLRDEVRTALVELLQPRYVPPTHDITADPWPLVVHLLQMGYHVSVRDCAPVRGDVPKQCTVAHPERPPVQHRAPSSVQAICEAALAALRREAA